MHGVRADHAIEVARYIEITEQIRLHAECVVRTLVAGELEHACRCVHRDDGSGAAELHRQVADARTQIEHAAAVWCGLNCDPLEQRCVPGANRVRFVRHVVVVERCLGIVVEPFDMSTVHLDHPMSRFDSSYFWTFWRGSFDSLPASLL